MGVLRVSAGLTGGRADRLVLVEVGLGGEGWGVESGGDK